MRVGEIIGTQDFHVLFFYTPMTEAAVGLLAHLATRAKFMFTPQAQELWTTGRKRFSGLGLPALLKLLIQHSID